MEANIIILGISFAIIFFMNIGLKRFIKIKLVRWFVNVFVFLIVFVFLVSTKHVYLKQFYMKQYRTMIKDKEYSQDDLFFIDETQPLRLNIELNKQIYSVGDTIKAVYSIENISDDPVAFLYLDGSDFESLIIPVEKRQHEYIFDSRQTLLSTLLTYKIIQPHFRWRREEEIADIVIGKEYEVGSAKPSSEEPEPYYEGFHFRLKQTQRLILIKEGYGKYRLSSQFCASKDHPFPPSQAFDIEDEQGNLIKPDSEFKPAKNLWTGCIGSNIVEFSVVEK